MKLYGTDNPNKFDKLLDEVIVGVIDRNGVAHSQKFHFSERKTHGDIYPTIHEKRWVWDYDKGVTFSVYGDTFEYGDGDIIRNHIRRTYGIRFWENGYHDIEYFMSKLSKLKQSPDL